VSTLYLTHPACLEHDNGFGHPERADRLRAIERALEHETFQSLLRDQAPRGTLDQAALAHPRAYVDRIERMAPEHEIITIDSDTSMSPGSLEAALRSIGGATMAVDEVMTGKVKNAFSATRPPGHHAEKTTAMGFCLFNNAAVAARYAQQTYGIEKAAVIDFDVHHGNGTQDIFFEDASVFYGSTHQMPLYPGTGAPTERGQGNICNAPLMPGDGGAEFKEAMEAVILPALQRFAPELLIISAGFDAHTRDPLANINLVEEDFAWITKRLLEVADACCAGRVVSLLEGGYDLQGLALSAAAHVRALMEA